LLCFTRRPRERNHVGGGSLNFAAFQRWRTECLIAQPGLLDCGETNLYRSLASLQPALRAASPTEHIYRCDLARAWLKRYGFSDERSRQALVNRGVRHALSLIFRELAHTSAVLWIPADVYPVYAELAESAGIQPRLFVTLPKPHGIPARRESVEAAGTFSQRTRVCSAPGVGRSVARPAHARRLRL
jgi:hypothetical protein